VGLKNVSASGGVGPFSPMPGVAVQGVFTGTIPNTTPIGSVQGYGGNEGTSAENCQSQIPSDYANSNNYYWVCYGMAPAYWTNSFSGVAALVQYPLQVVFFHLFERS
jgi:hypothetical protein